MGDFPTDEFEKVEHAKILGKLVNYWSSREETETDPDTTPSEGTTYAAKTLWQNVGSQADTLAQDLASGLKTLLDGGNGSWEGDAAEEFRKTVEEIIRFTREIAHTADSKYPKPSSGAEESDSNFESGSATKSFVQVLTDVDDQLTATQKDEALPPPPFWTEPHWVKWWWAGYEIRYEVRKGTGDGSIITPPGRGAAFDYHEFAGGDSGTGGFYGEAQVRVERDYDGIVFGNLPVDNEQNDKLMSYLKFNEEQEKTCRESAQTLLEKYGDANDSMPTPPTGLKLSFQSGDPGAFGGGGGGGGGAPDIPKGGVGKPDLPDSTGSGKPDLPDTNLPDRDGDGIPDTEDKYPDDPTRGGPSDPKLPKVPGDRDGDGIPDTQDKYPNDPDNGGNNFPDLPGRDSDGDGIPDTSDPFPNDPTRGGGGTGGLPGDIDTGTSTARAGGGGGIGSLPGGMGGPAAGGGIAGGGGLAGGGVPLGLPPGSINAGGVGTGGVNGIGGAAVGPGAMRGGMGGMMPPMGGGGGMAAQDGDEQGRTTWLDEDEDVWGGNDDDAPPSVLGGGF